jgi:hypothetical protein
VVRDPRWPDPVLTKDDCVPGCVLSAPHFDACQNTVSAPVETVVVVGDPFNPFGGAHVLGVASPSERGGSGGDQPATGLRCLHGQCVEAKAYGKHAQGYTDEDIDRIVAKGLNAEARLTVAVDVVELAEDVARTLLEADGPCPYCGSGEDDDYVHAADCALDLLFNKARAALGKE